MLDNVAFLCAPTMRSRAYAQAMVKHDLLPSFAVCLAGQEPEWGSDTQIPEQVDWFKPGERARNTLIGAGVNVYDAKDESPNEVTYIIAPIIIYSGPPGVLLTPKTLKMGKFLHIHGGVLPEYRGSTAFYYSLLKEGTIGASALWLDEGIDTGAVIAIKTVQPTKNLEIDRLQDPLLRAELLVSVLREIAFEKIPEGKKLKSDAPPCYVIHPVLKHLALCR